MDIIIYAPSWFFGYDSIAEIISMFILFFIGFYSSKLYKLSQQKKYKHFYLSFMVLGVAFFAKSITNWIMYREWVEHDIYIGKVIELYFIYNVGYLIHVLLSLTAYMLLLLLLWDIHDRRLISLFFIFIVIAAFFAHQTFISFHVVSLILLCYLTWEFWKNAHNSKIKTRPKTAYLVFSSFLVITLSQLVFLFMNSTPLLYVAGEIVQLTGYVMLLVTLLILFLRK